MERVIRETSLPLPLHGRGKARDIWQLPNDGNLLIVATDRISAFDVVVGLIPGKGKVLTKMSEFWFRFLRDLVPHHFVSTDLSAAYSHEVWLHAHDNDLEGRSMIVKKADHVIPVECVVRGYLAGSGWQEYKKTGEVCGIRLPEGLTESAKLEEPIFTPATKAERGVHDENITFGRMQQIVGSEVALRLRDVSLAIYSQARDFAEERGILLADTKFEFGWLDGQPILIDEVLTPDSSRFWPASEWKPGQTQKSFDKQFLRDYLLSIGWNKKPPAPELPEEVILATKEKYEEALRRLVS